MLPLVNFLYILYKKIQLQIIRDFILATMYGCIQGQITLLIKSNNIKCELSLLGALYIVLVIKNDPLLFN